MTGENQSADPREWLAQAFENKRAHLQAVAYRMLGSRSEADDAVQEAWLRLDRTDAAEIQNLGGWLTTVVARVCLDMLRARNSRREDPFGEAPVETVATDRLAPDPEQEALLADSVGLAVLVVLERLTPAERLAFVLHDMFLTPFEEIAPILGRSLDATRQLASRARRRVQGAGAPADASLSEHRDVAKAFMAALHAGDFQGLMAVLDPDVVVRLDEAAAARPGAPRELRGAEKWARSAIAFSQSARGTAAFVQMAGGTEAMLVDGSVGLVIAPGGRVERVLRFTIVGGKITEVEIVADRKRLAEMEFAVLE